MERSHPPRRNFIKQVTTLAVSLSVCPALASTGRVSLFDETKPPLAAGLVKEFVGAAHGNLARVKELLTKEPLLANACWDWGGGDYETALGAPSHTGNRDIARYLLDHGARKDIFCAAMLGDLELVRSFIQSDPGIVNVLGPHRLSLLYHAAISGNTDMAKAIHPHLTALAADANQALHAAVRGNQLAMTEWLLNNGVTNPDTKDFAGNTPVVSAEKKGYRELVLLLRKQ